MMNLFRREIKANRIALIIWCVCMFSGILMGMSKYTAYSSGSASSRIISEMPRSIKALFGMGTLDVTKIKGFYAFLFLYIEVTAAIHAVLLGSGIIAKEERDKTAEFLIVKPLSRAAVVTSKFLAALVNILIVNLVSLASSVTLAAAYSKEKNITGEIVTFMLSMFIVQLVFLTLGTFLSAKLRNPKTSGSVAASVLLASFVFYEITNFSDRLDFLKILSPFQYFNYDRIVGGGGLEPVPILLSLLLSAAFCRLTYFFYQKRDLNV